MSLEARGIEVRFGGIVALSNVSVSVEPGKITAVIGPNGSGKSTLFNAITGLVSPTQGIVTLDGANLAGQAPHKRIANGIGRTFQTPRFDPFGQVIDSVMCGFYPGRSTSALATFLGLPSAVRQEVTLHARALTILKDLGLDTYSNVALSLLSMGHLRLVEVARAVANAPKYILLDEPAAGLSLVEQNRLSDEIKRLAAGGVGVLLVEHNFTLIRRLADDVLVLDRGHELCRGNGATIERDPRVIDVYLGQSGKPARDHNH